MSDAPSVAVVMPVYNSGSFVTDAVASALAQTVPDLRVVVVDDGSTDPQTLSALAGLPADPRLTLIRQPNRGQAAARNTAIEHADAEFFLPLDGDDLIDPTYAEKALTRMADPDVGIVHCTVTQFGDREGVWHLPPPSWDTMLIFNSIVVTSLFRTDDWRQVGGFDESMRVGLEDHDFILKILGLGRRPEQVDEALFHYRIRSGSVSRELSRQRRIAAQAQIMRNNLALYGDHAEELMAFVIDQAEELRILRHRYAAVERLRGRAPWLTGMVGRARRTAQRLRGLSGKARSS